MPAKFFTVIIPTHNRLEWLQEALQSVSMQSFGDYEVVVIDDGSTDGTWEYLQGQGNHIRVFRQPQSGPGAARNMGIQEAKSQYVAFLDSDDRWFPWTLALYHEAIQQHQHPSFITGSAVPLLGAAALPAEDRLPMHSKNYPSLLHACNGEMPPVHGTPSICIETKLLKHSGGFCPEPINGEDVDLWLRLGDAPGFVQISQPPVFAQRKHSLNASRNLDATLRGAHYLITQEKAGRYPGGKTFQRPRLRILAANTRAVMLAALKSGYVGEAWALFRSTLSWQIKLRRMRFILAFPWLACLSTLHGTRSRRLRFQ